MDRLRALPYITCMDTKQLRNEWQANLLMQQTVETVTRVESWTIPAPKRAARTVKRTMWATLKTLFTFWK